MRAALAPPFLVASLVLCLAGALKLRSPAAAADALRSLTGAMGATGAAWGAGAAGAAGAVDGGALGDRNRSDAPRDQNRIFRSDRGRRRRQWRSRWRWADRRRRGQLERHRGTGATWAVRVLAAGEVALGAACVVRPTWPLAVALAIVYGLFAAVAVMLMRRRAACGCFGESELPVSLAHVLATGLLGAVALAAAIVGPGGLGWLLARPAPEAAVLLIGVAGALYATVLVYTELPRAWAAWSGE